MDASVCQSVGHEVVTRFSRPNRTATQTICGISSVANLSDRQRLRAINTEGTIGRIAVDKPPRAVRLLVCLLGTVFVVATRAGATPPGSEPGPRSGAGGGVAPARSGVSARAFRAAQSAAFSERAACARSSERPRRQPDGAPRHCAPLRGRTSSCGECGERRGEPSLPWSVGSTFGSPSGRESATHAVATATARC